MYGEMTKKGYMGGCNKNKNILNFQWKYYELPSLFSMFNPFVPNAPFLCPMKISGAEKGCVGKEWVKRIFWSLSWLHKPTHPSKSLVGAEYWFAIIVYIIYGISLLYHFSKSQWKWYADRIINYWLLCRFSCFISFES